MTEPPVATRANEDTGPEDTPPVPAAAGTTSPARGWRSWPGRTLPTLRRHWLASLLVAAGLVLRLLAQLAYRPALVYVDSLKYLYANAPGSDPLGYKVVLKVLLVAGHLDIVVAVQHLLGLGMAIALYMVLLRCGVPRWLAALAIAPVLLDAYQIQMEQMIMPDPWFEAMVVAGLVLVLWRPRLTIPLAVLAGLVLGASATMRQIGEYLILPVLLYVLVSGIGWRRWLVRGVAMTVAFVAPILLYCGVSEVRTGHFWLARGQSSIGRTAAAADCATLRVPPAVKALCPSPAQQALGPDYLEHSGQSPLYATPEVPGTRAGLMRQLNNAIKHQQPLRVAKAILRDSVRLFALTRDQVKSVTPISRWQFQTTYPAYAPFTKVRNHTIIIGLQPIAFHKITYVPLKPSYGNRAQVSKPLASFLRAYQLDGGYTPGPLYALCVAVGLLACLVALLYWRAGEKLRALAAGSLLFTGCAALLLFVPDVFEFSWRYELPAVIVLPPACALGLMTLVGLRRDRRDRAAAAEAPAAAA